MLERKITDLPEKHSVIQIHTGKVKYFTLRSFDRSKEETMLERLLNFFLMFGFFSSAVPKYKSYEEVAIDWDFPQSKFEKLSCRVFTDLWEQGYFLTSGGKFGGSFLVYPGLFSDTTEGGGSALGMRGIFFHFLWP